MVKRLAPRSLVAFGQRQYTAFVTRRQHSKYRLRIEPFDDLFPEAEKVQLSASETIPTSRGPEVSFEPFRAYEEAAWLQHPPYTSPPVFTAALSNVLYSRKNVVLTEGRSVIAESINSRRSTAWLDEEALLAPRVIDLPGYSTALRSMHNNHYHTLIDNLPRISCLLHPYFEQFERINVLTSAPPSTVEAFFLSGLLPKNAQVQVLSRKGTVDALYRPEHYLFLSFPSRAFSGYLPHSYVHTLRKQFCPARPSRRDRRIYISRSQARHRRVLNEEAVLKTLRQEGFEPWRLETMRMEDQIELFYDAEAVVAPHGAGLANLLFSERASVVELSPTPAAMPHFYFLCRARGHTYRLWCADRSDRNADFVVDLHALRSTLRDVLPQRSYGHPVGVGLYWPPTRTESMPP